MEHGIAIKNEVFAQTMYKQYSALQKEVRSLLVRGNEPKTINDFLPKVENKAGEIGCFSEQLCMVGCLDREMLEKHIYPDEGREELVETILNTRGDWNGLERKEKTYGVDELLSYGSYKGVEDFMKTGRIKEFPEVLYTPLTVEERKQVLARVIFLKEKGVRYRFVLDKVAMPGSIHIYWIDGKKRFTLNRITDKDFLCN